MQFRQQFVQKQTLKQKLSPKMIQMFNIFHSSYDQLVDQIHGEQDQNVFIEITQSDQLSYNASKSNTAKNEIDDFTTYTEDRSGETLTHFLLKQINYVGLSPLKKQVLEKLIDHLDNKGFLLNFSAVKKDIQESLYVSSTIVMDCLRQLQEFEPEGVGARSLEECLLIQLDHFEFSDEDLITPLKQVINHHLNDLADKNYETIAMACNIPIEGVEAVANFIKRNFNPNPASQFSSIERHLYITPSFDISYDNGLLKIKNLEQEKGIKISISQEYITLLNDPNTDAKTKQFLQEKYDKAKELQTNLQQRKETLEKLVGFIARQQSLYFQKGNNFLRPLLQKEVASHLDLTPSSVSRILSSKFVITPFETIPLKHLCPRRYFGKTKQQFKAFLQHFFQEHPSYSDQKISNALRDHGIKIARRTVAKYRYELRLKSSYFDGRKPNTDEPLTNPQET